MNSIFSNLLSEFRIEPAYDRIRLVSCALHLEMKHINHSLSLQFSIKMTCDADDYQNTGACLVLEEQLTLAYTGSF